MRLNCNFCGKGLEKEWRFCPFCGAPVMQSQAEIDMTNIMRQTISKIMPMFGNIISISPGNQARQETQQKQSLNERMNRPAPKIDEVIEPQEETTSSGDMMVHKIFLPGVKSKSDITITKMENSIEIRGLAGRKLYMKIIGREKKQSVISESFDNGILTMTLKKVSK